MNAAKPSADQDQEEDPIPLSALQHYLYCPRQCALIHLEQLWSENALTAEGRLLHQRADSPGAEQRHGVRTVTAMPLRHTALGIAGVADVVEFHPRAAGPPQALPVEYKRGRPKAHRADEVQLCAQALCLEDMLGQPVSEGALFYGQTRRRRNVVFDADLRALTLNTIASTRALLAAGRTPPPVDDARRCSACSLIDDCQPQWARAARRVAPWLQTQLQAPD
ncbi:CRISPR-associated protein Cas4 [Vandammella animalimorsus]|uniref:CRISPR-associated protein Cas4 n=1 Tax=Vandammella animalimorsus TaxID=2029117 RepID=UPI0031BB62C6